MPNVSLGSYNTLAVAAASGAYRLKPANGFSCTVDLMNAGAGAIYLRPDIDPTVADPKSLLVPANTALNGFTIDGATGIGVIAGADTTISVRIR